MVLRRQDAPGDILRCQKGFLLGLARLDVGIDRDGPFPIAAPDLDHGFIFLQGDQIGERHQLPPVIADKKAVDLGARVLFALFQLNADVVTMSAFLVSADLDPANHRLDDLRDAGYTHTVFIRLLAVGHHVEFGLAEGIIGVHISDQAGLSQLIHDPLRIIGELIPVRALDREFHREPPGGCKGPKRKVLDHRAHVGDLFELFSAKVHKLLLAQFMPDCRIDAALTAVLHGHEYRTAVGVAGRTAPHPKDIPVHLGPF